MLLGEHLLLKKGLLLLELLMLESMFLLRREGWLSIFLLAICIVASVTITTAAAAGAATTGRMSGDGHVRIGHSQCAAILEVLLLEGYGRFGPCLGRIFRFWLTILRLLLQRELLRREGSTVVL